MSKEKPLSYEQIEAALYLVADDLCWICLHDHGVPVGPAAEETVSGRNAGYVCYTVEARMNDTFYWASSDFETIPWDEVVQVANDCRSMSDTMDRYYYLVDYAARKRGHDPKIPQVLKELNEWRRKRNTRTEQECERLAREILTDTEVSDE